MSQASQTNDLNVTAKVANVNAIKKIFFVLKDFSHDANINFSADASTGTNSGTMRIKTLDKHQSALIDVRMKQLTYTDISQSWYNIGIDIPTFYHNFLSCHNPCYSLSMAVNKNGVDLVCEEHFSNVKYTQRLLALDEPQHVVMDMDVYVADKNNKFVFNINSKHFMICVYV